MRCFCKGYGLYDDIWQAFAVILPVKASHLRVQGDEKFIQLLELLGDPIQQVARTSHATCGIASRPWG
jgi:GMP synthase PP-ATPase subunit